VVCRIPEEILVELFEVDKTYRIHVDTETGSWVLPLWVQEYNRTISMDEKRSFMTYLYINSPFKVYVRKITTNGIWVELYAPEEVEPRPGLMQFYWKDILTIEVE
jgi:hypothetical protein